MNASKKLAAIATIVATFATASLFAEERRRGSTEEWRRPHRGTQHVTVEGRVHDIDRNRNDFVIRLDRGGYVLVVDNDSNALRGVERGDFIRASGIVNQGTLRVTRLVEVRDEDDRGGRDDHYVTGRVERIDRRGNMIWIEVERSNRVVAVDVRNVDRKRWQYDVDNLRRGDRITVRGDWQRNGRFEAERLDVDRSSRW